MTTELKNQQSTLDIRGDSYTLAVDIFREMAPGFPTPGPAENISQEIIPDHSSKLPDGWHDTAKHGPVFVTPAGKSWGVKIIGNKFENVIVETSTADFIGKSIVEKRKEAVRKAARRQVTRGQRTASPILTAGEAEDVN
jgi:hypothetical protein